MPGWVLYVYPVVLLGGQAVAMFLIYRGLKKVSK